MIVRSGSTQFEIAMRMMEDGADLGASSNSPQAKIEFDRMTPDLRLALAAE